MSLTTDYRFKEADDIYSLGIARKASPLMRLETRYRGFKRRMLSYGGPQAPNGDQTSEASTAPQHTRPSTQRKKILGELSQASGGSGGLVASTSTFKPKSKPNSCFVFSDETAGKDGPDPSPWSDLGTKQSRRKENTIPVTKAGDGIPLSGSKVTRRVISAPTRGAFVPFEDDEPEAASLEGLPGKDDQLSEITVPKRGAFTVFSSDEGSSSSLLQVKESHKLTESEALKKDPLKNYQNHDGDYS
jgi:hypothetical protein